SSSPVSTIPKRIAILPAVGTLVKAAMLLRRTVPWAVANMMWSLPHSASSSGRGSTVEMVSPSESGSRLTIGRPLVLGPPSGSFRQLGNAGRCELRVDLVELLAHHLVEAGAIGENFEQFADARGELFKLTGNLIAAERGQAVEAQLEDRFYLRL